VRKFRTTKLCPVTPKISGSSVSPLLHSTILAPRILRGDSRPLKNMCTHELLLCTVVWTRRAAITRANTLYLSPYACLSFASSVFSEETTAYKQQGPHISDSRVTLVLWVRIPLSALITGETVLHPPPPHTHKNTHARVARLKKGTINLRFSMCSPQTSLGARHYSRLPIS